MVVDRAGVGEEAVERDEGGNAGEEGQQGVEGDAGRDRRAPGPRRSARRRARGCPSSPWPGSRSASRRRGRDPARSTAPSLGVRALHATARPSWLRAAGSCRSVDCGGADPRLRPAVPARGRAPRAGFARRASSRRRAGTARAPCRSVERLVCEPAACGSMRAGGGDCHDRSVRDENGSRTARKRSGCHDNGSVGGQVPSSGGLDLLGAMAGRAASRADLAQQRALDPAALDRERAARVEGAARRRGRAARGSRRRSAGTRPRRPRASAPPPSARAV